MVRSIYQQITYLDPVVYDWAHIKVKTLVLGGELDGQDFPELAKHIADTIPGARAGDCSEGRARPAPGDAGGFQPGVVEVFAALVKGDGGFARELAVAVELDQVSSCVAGRPSFGCRRAPEAGTGSVPTVRKS